MYKRHAQFYDDLERLNAKCEDRDGGKGEGLLVKNEERNGELLGKDKETEESTQHGDGTMRDTEESGDKGGEDEEKEAAKLRSEGNDARQEADKEELWAVE